MPLTTVERLSAARAEIEKAEARIAETLSREPATFLSAADLRNQFNEARSLKLSASQRLAILKVQEDLAG